MRKENHWKTSDIKLRKDSVGYYDAEHTHAGLLFETEYYSDRNSARRAAVKALKQKKQWWLGTRCVPWDLGE